MQNFSYILYTFSEESSVFQFILHNVKKSKQYLERCLSYWDWSSLTLKHSKSRNSRLRNLKKSLTVVRSDLWSKKQPTSASWKWNVSRLKGPPQEGVQPSHPLLGGTGLPHRGKSRKAGHHQTPPFLTTPAVQHSQKCRTPCQLSLS